MRLYLMLAAALFVVGLIAVLLGFDLAQIDQWLDANGDGVSTFGDWLMRGFWTLLFLVSVFAAVGMIASLLGMAKRRMPGDPVKEGAARRKAEQAGDDESGPLGTGCFALVAAIIAYFAWFGMTG